MSQRKLIAVFGVIALLGLTTGTSQATRSRVEALGLGDPVLSQFIDDNANIYTFPTSVVRQNNIVVVEAGNNSDGDVNEVSFDDQSLTLVRNFPNFGSIAFQMKQSALNSTFPSNLNNEQLDIIWGKAFAKVDFAVRLDVTNSFAEVSIGGSEASIRGLGPILDLDGTLGFPAIPFDVEPGLIPDDGVEMNSYGITPAIAIHMENDNRIEGAATYRKHTFEQTSTGGPTFEDEGNSSFLVIGRAVLIQNDNHTWYPAAWYRKDDLSWTTSGIATAPDQDPSAEETYKFLGAGISDNMRVNENNQLIWGVVAAQGKFNYERGDDDSGGFDDTVSNMEVKESWLPLVFAAFETEATGWLKLRVGATRTHLMTRTEITDFAGVTVEEKDRTSSFDFFLGTGIRFNNLDVDMTMNEAFPLSGGYILSGDSETPFTRVSATYHF